jgi:hypothetical protein
MFGLISGDVLDPDKHRNNGQACEASRQWQPAAEHYYKALCCLPIIPGGQDWYRHYLHGNKKPVAYSKPQISELYAAIGRCMFAMGRLDNARLNLEASQYWDPHHPDVQQLLNRTENTTISDSAPFNAVNLEETDNSEFFHDRVTVVVVTNLTKKLIRYRELAPPSTNLIAATFGSMIDVFGPSVLACPRVICYDSNFWEPQASDPYLTALEHFCRRHRFDLAVYLNTGLLGVLKSVLPTITTPYLFLIEHDWFFKSPQISLGKVLSVLDRRDDIHMIRFNKRRNVISTYDFILERETEINEIPLLRTSAYSNNPSLIRTRTLRDIWLPICLEDPFFSARDIRGTPLGVEEALMKARIEAIRKHGFSMAHLQWGGYIYGAAGDEQRIIHLGE